MQQIIKETAHRLGLSEDLVRTVIRSYFRAFRQSLTQVKYHKLSNLDGLKLNAILIGFGKMIVSQAHRKRYKKQRNNERENNSEIN